nr:immunoglobulin light chain junction region [Macaca mulatta]
CMQNTHLPYSF